MSDGLALTGFFSSTCEKAVPRQELEGFFATFEDQPLTPPSTLSTAFCKALESLS